MSVMYTIVCNWSNVLYMHACLLLRQLVGSKLDRLEILLILSQ